METKEGLEALFPIFPVPWVRTALAGIVRNTSGILQGIVFEQQSPRLRMETEALVLPGLFPKYCPSAFFRASLTPPHCPDPYPMPQ